MAEAEDERDPQRQLLPQNGQQQPPPNPLAPLAPHPLPPMAPLYLPKSARRSAEADRDTPLHTACLTRSYDQVYTFTMTSSWKHLQSPQAQPLSSNCAGEGGEVLSHQFLIAKITQWQCFPFLPHPHTIKFRGRAHLYTLPVLPAATTRYIQLGPRLGTPFYIMSRILSSSTVILSILHV